MRAQINDTLKWTLEQHRETWTRFPVTMVASTRNGARYFPYEEPYIEINTLEDIVELAKLCSDGLRVDVSDGGVAIEAELYVGEFTMEYRT